MTNDSKKILVCQSTGCVSSQSDKIKIKLEEGVKANSLNDIKVDFTGCHGFCSMGPIVIIEPEGIMYCQVDLDKDVDKIVDGLKNGVYVEELFYEEPFTKKKIPKYKEIPFYAKQNRVVLDRCGHINPENFDHYIQTNGYTSLHKILKMQSREVIDIIKKSRLRGRGGAGFPTGLKWEFAANSKSDTKYVICNADEGDPGAFMDRTILEADPHAVLEGLMICAYAIGAKKGIIYVRAEYPLAVKRLEIAIDQLKERNMLGNNILGTYFSFDIELFKGAGAFVCGEETAMMNSIMGGRGEPRPRPPYPAVSGLWGKPTNINNVKTLATVPKIIAKGAEWFSSLGTDDTSGTAIFALAGDTNNAGLVEVPMGTSLREIIFEIGGGVYGGKKFKAVQTGGPSGGCLPETMLDSNVDFGTLKESGSIMGSGGFIVCSEETCMVDLARYFLSFTQNESCGKCTPCREGTLRGLEILEKITGGKASMDDLNELENLANVIKDTSLCALGQTAPNPVLTTLKYFREEYIEHIEEKKCRAKVCKNLFYYEIIKDNCINCARCQRNCPVNAISGSKEIGFTIYPQICTRCGICFQACPVNNKKKTFAIVKRSGIP